MSYLIWMYLYEQTVWLSKFFFEAVWFDMKTYIKEVSTLTVNNAYNLVQPQEKVLSKAC